MKSHYCWDFFRNLIVIILVLVSLARCSEETKDQDALKKDFMPSHQILFRRNDGELLLPALAPYLGSLQPSASNAINNYNTRPSYGSQEQDEQVTCLLRTCDQYITGRDLSYQRTLEIVQNEEYLVAVDADLIRRRQDYGHQGSSDATTENFGTTWNLPLGDHLKLTQYLSTIGKRKKRESENNEDLKPIDREERILLLNGTGFGHVNYDWRSVADQYLRFGAATALLFGLASYLPAPAEPILPIQLQSLSSKDSKDEGKLVESPDHETSFYQVYQENAPKRVYQDGEDKKIPDDAFFKRIDLLAAFRPKKNRRPRPQRPRQGQPPKILDPVQNTKKRQIPKEDALLKPVAKHEEIKLSEKVPESGELEKSPFLTDSDFKEFFPSWSRKKRATVVTEGRIFNITSAGFGTVTYDWRDVIDTYLSYFVTGGLILAAASLLTVPSKPFIPLDLPAFGDARINPTNLPPNLPPGLVPPGNPLPGTPGGGSKPVGNTPDAQEAIALVPRGTIPVAIFPPYATPRTVPAVSVIFLETATPGLVKRQGYVWSGFDSLARSYNCMKAKLFRRKKRQTSSYGVPECEDNYSHLRYGFRTRVALVENQSCILDVTCSATGDRINAALSKRNGFAKRQTGEEFRSDAPPECRAIRDPSNSCRNYYK